MGRSQFTYYIISQGGGLFPNYYACNFDTIAMGKTDYGGWGVEFCNMAGKIRWFTIFS